MQTYKFKFCKFMKQLKESIFYFYVCLLIYRIFISAIFRIFQYQYFDQYQYILMSSDNIMVPVYKEK